MTRIANGQGFWGDWLEAPVRLVEQGPIDYLTLDYLAEVTMSILQKMRQSDENLGYVRDFPPLVERIAAALKSKQIRVVANAGGVNPLACAREVKRRCPSLCVAVVTGDDILDRIDDLTSDGLALANMDTGEPIHVIREDILSANTYIGAFPIAEALNRGANVVITGRCADAALALGPMIHEFGWKEDDWDLLAAGVIGGHVIECGTQVTGGNCQHKWQEIPDLAHIGYPVLEVERDGSLVITKHPGTGGRVSPASVKEQLLYEVGDPARYITPDVVADFTSITLEEAGMNRVRIHSAKGRPKPELLKVSIAYHYGWKAVASLVYSAPDAYEKARVADQVVRQRLKDANLAFEKIHTEYFGLNACHGHLAPFVEEPPEVELKIGVRDRERSKVDQFTRQLIPLVLSGPPGATGFGEGRPYVREIVAYWPTLIPRNTIRCRVEVVN